MPPEQNQNQPNPYDFITSPVQAPTGGFGSFNKKQRILLVVIASVVIIIIFVVVSSFLGKAGQAQNQKLAELAQTQTEIVRIASIGFSKSKNLETKSLAINTQLSVESSKQDTRNALKKRGVKIKDKTLAAGKNTKTDALLQEATINNRFDQTFTEIIQTMLASYQRQAKSVYESSNPGEQKIFKPSINGVSLLLPKSKAQE